MQATFRNRADPNLGPLGFSQNFGVKLIDVSGKRCDIRLKVTINVLDLKIVEILTSGFGNRTTSGRLSQILGGRQRGGQGLTSFLFLNRFLNLRF